MRAKTRGEIVIDIQKDLSQIAGLDEGNPTGILTTLVNGIGRSIERLWSETSFEFDQTFPSTARGTGLDDWADRVGLTRKVSQKASSSSIQTVYVSSGTFGDLSGGVPIFIQNGTTISSQNGKYTVQVSSNGTRNSGGINLDPTVGQQSIPVISLSDDPNESIPTGVLTVFNGPVKGLKSRNVAVIRGTNIETDDNLRYRIELKMKSERGDNEAAIRLAVLSVPGISNARFVPFSRGGGSMDILIIGTEGEVESGILNLAKSAAYRVSSTTYFTVRSVGSSSLRIVVTGDQTDRAIANQIFLEYIDSLGPGEPFVFRDFQRLSGGLVEWGYAYFNKVKTTDQIISIPQEYVFVADSSEGDPARIIS